MTAGIRTLRLVAALAVSAVVVTGCAATGTVRNATAWTPVGVRAEASVVADLPVQSIADVGAMRLADGLAPPTNRWFSGLVFGDAPQPVFPFPLAFATDGSSFTVDLPVVAASATAIAAPFAGGLAVALEADSFEVVRYDPVSVTLRYEDADGPIGDLTIAEGSPVVSFTAARETTLSPEAALKPSGDGLWTASADETTFGVKAPGARLTESGLDLAPGNSAQWFVVPSDSSAEAWAASLGDPVTSVATSYAATDASSSTHLDYEGTTRTVVVPFPGRAPERGCDLGTFETAYGIATACAATSLDWSVPSIAPAAAYDLRDLDSATRDAVASQAAQDLAATGPFPADTYFGGKALARLATLLELARSLGDDELAAETADRLWTELEPWVEASRCEKADARCFVYDDALHLVVGRTPSFGAEEGNDHHFHYGYFLTAAAALVQERPELLDDIEPVIDALAADIAGGAGDEALPALRVFDPYRGHSWASGLSPFADGNNQESSSEAVAAWNGLALWAEASGDDALAAEAGWLLSAEADSARALWLAPDLSDIPDGYDHGIVSLTWGAKRDYGTWFSAEPSAILGIQLIPLGPVSLAYLGSDPERVAADVAEAGGDAAFRGALGDQVLQYSALAGPDALAAAEKAAAALPDDAIDDGGSRSAMLAWLAAVRLAQG